MSDVDELRRARILEIPAITPDLSFEGAEVRPVSDASYLHVAQALIRSAVHRCLCSMFIIDHGLDGSSFSRIDDLLVGLAAASWRGVDTRLVVGGSRDNVRLRRSALLAHARARTLGVPARLAAARPGHPSHFKVLLVDDQVLTGSHNWAPGILGTQLQDSVLVRSETLGTVVCDIFDGQWDEIGTEAYDVSI